MLKIVAIAFLASFVAANPVKVEDCGSKNGQIVSIDIDPCPKMPCELKLNTNVNISIDFSSKVPSNSVTISVAGIVDGYPQDDYLDDPNACDHGVKCPVKVGDRNVVNITLYVEYDFPVGPIEGKLQLQDDNMEDIACAIVNVTVPGVRGFEAGHAIEKPRDTVLRFKKGPYQGVN